MKMDEILSAQEITARFAPDWVLIGDPQTDDHLNLLAGKVLFPGPARDEVYRVAKELRPGRFSAQYLGTWPENMVLVL
jgi:hypothetical protein